MTCASCGGELHVTRSDLRECGRQLSARRRCTGTVVVRECASCRAACDSCSGCGDWWQFALPLFVTPEANTGRG